MFVAKTMRKSEAGPLGEHIAKLSAERKGLDDAVKLAQARGTDQWDAEDAVWKLRDHADRLLSVARDGENWWGVRAAVKSLGQNKEWEKLADIAEHARTDVAKNGAKEELKKLEPVDVLKLTRKAPEEGPIVRGMEDSNAPWDSPVPGVLMEEERPPFPGPRSKRDSSGVIEDDGWRDSDGHLGSGDVGERQDGGVRDSDGHLGSGRRSARP